MELPEWARRALVPANPESEHGQWLAEMENPLRKRWRDMQADKWKVPPEHFCYLESHWDELLTPADLVRKRILETALDVAWDKHCGKDPRGAAQAAKKVWELNEKIKDAATALADLFRERAALVHANALDDQNDWQSLEPFDLWDALQSATEQPEFMGWQQTARREINAFLRIAREQSRPGPGWADLLGQLSLRLDADVRLTDAGDIAAARSKTNGTEFSRWALQLMGALDTGWHGTYPPGFLLGCLDVAQLATLVETVFGTPADAPINDDQMRKLLARYTDRKNAGIKAQHSPRTIHRR